MTSQIKTDGFCWVSYDLDDRIIETLGLDWYQAVIDFSIDNLHYKEITPTSVTSRDDRKRPAVQTAVVDGRKIKDGLPELYKLYHGDFKYFAEQAMHEKLSCAENDLYGVNLNVQQGTGMEYDCHVDSNPVQGLFYLTTQTEQEGGALIVANRPDIIGIDNVQEDATVIEPKRGRLVFFDARRYGHYVNRLKNPSAVRAVAAMNFYTQDCPESERPADLNKHLGLTP